MHTRINPQSQPQGERLLDDADHLLTSVQRRLRHIATFSLWSQQSAALVAEVKVQMASASAELALAQEELKYLRRSAARRVGLDPEDFPPQTYLDAVRTPQYEPYRAVAVEIDGEEWVIGLKRDRPTDVDPAREVRDWHKLVTAVREVRQTERS